MKWVVTITDKEIFREEFANLVADFRHSHAVPVTNAWERRRREAKLAHCDGRAYAKPELWVSVQSQDEPRRGGTRKHNFPCVHLGAHPWNLLGGARTGKTRLR